MADLPPHLVPTVFTKEVIENMSKVLQMRLVSAESAANAFTELGKVIKTEDYTLGKGTVKFDVKAPIIKENKKEKNIEDHPTKIIRRRLNLED